MMRHSKLEMTGRYTRPRAVDIEAAASMLPSLKPQGDKPDSLAATGTHGHFGHRQPSDSTTPAALDAGNSSQEGQPISKRFGHHLATAGDVSGGFPRLPDVMTGSDGPALTNEKPLVSKGFEASRCSEMLLTRVTGEGLEPSTNGLTFRPSIDTTSLILLDLYESAIARVAISVALESETGAGSVPVIASDSGLSPSGLRLGSIEAAASKSTARGRVYRPVISNLE